ncbi:sulfite exporter TauE/SafE family protein [Bordetella flabilis]
MRLCKDVGARHHGGMNTLLDFYRDGGTGLILLVAASFCVAGLVKGVIGLGLPTVSIGLLSVAMAPPQAAALLIIPSMVTNVWQLAVGGRFLYLMRRLWPLLLGIVVGTLGVGIWLAGRETAWAGHALGAALMIYAAVGLSGARLSVPPGVQAWAGPIVGATTGGIASMTGVFVIPAVPYLQALGLDKDELVQAMGLAFTASTIALAGDLIHGGQLGGREAWASLLALLPALAGMMAGQWLRHRVSAPTFRRCFFVGVGALGLHLLLAG